MVDDTSWRERLDDLSTTDRTRLLGGSLSERFARLPLSASQPPLVAGFYGLLAGAALILPWGVRTEWELDVWLTGWALQMIAGTLALSLLGLASMILVGWSRRAPVSLPRPALYAAPFIGLVWLTLRWTDLLALWPWVGWTLLYLPGPVYIHLTWAPRWRLLRRLEDGLDPFADGVLVPTVRRDDPDEADVLNELAPDLEQLDVDLDDLEDDTEPAVVSGDLTGADAPPASAD